MSIISITDSLGAIADLTINDASPVAKAKLSQLVSSGKSIVGSFARPVDQTDISGVALGADFTSPSLLSGIPSLKVSAGVNCDLAVLTSNDKVLFPDDGFSPVIPISANQAWVEFGIDASVDADFSASTEGFGIGVKGATNLSLLSFVMFEGAPLLPLKEALEQTIESFSVSSSAQAIRAQKTGTVNVCDVSGSVSVSGSYSFPFSLSPFASATLPFNFNVNVAPTATAKITGSIILSGDFLVRIHKISGTKVHLGVYKKRGSTFAVSLDADAGVAAGTGSTDLLGTLLNAVLPGVDAAKAGLPPDTAKQLNSVIKDGLDRSLSVELNAVCSAATTHEAAVLYEVDLSVDDEATNKALTAALKGYWTAVGKLPNSRLLRDITVVTKERKQKLNFNLLGVLSVSKLADYISTCTILRDDTGQLTVVDKVDSSRISAVTSPYAADPDKLRSALAEDFLATASYAVIADKLALKLTIAQSYLVYAKAMSRQQLRDSVALGNYLGVIPLGLFDGILSSNVSFPHARVAVSVTYDGDEAMTLFFSDVPNRTARTAGELETVGRDVLLGLIDADDPSNTQRLLVLGSDALWAAMDEAGGQGGFDAIPYLSHLNQVDRGAIGVDWLSVAWWRDAMLHVAPALADVLAAVAASNSADPRQDATFMSRRSKLQAALGSVARNTNDAFVGGWGPAVMFALSGRHGKVAMDIAWNSEDHTFKSAEGETP